MWKPDPDLLVQCTDILEDSVETLQGNLADEDARAEEAAALLEAAGTLAGLGAEDTVRATVDGADIARDACAAYLGGLDLTPLEAAAVNISREARRLMLLDPEENLELATELSEALERRDRLELLRMGAELVCPRHEFDAEQESAWLFFDDLVGADLWRLLSLGDARWVPAAWLKPELRARFPWRTRGYGLGRRALDSLTDAAELLVHFPEAKEHLDALMRTMQGDASAKANEDESAGREDAPALAQVIDLSRWRQGDVREADGRLAVAAADHLADTPGVELPGVEGLVELELRGSRLLAYLLPLDARAPHLEWTDGRAEGEHIQGTEAGYGFELPNTKEATLVIPVGDAERRVRLAGLRP